MSFELESKAELDLDLGVISDMVLEVSGTIWLIYSGILSEVREDVQGMFAPGHWSKKRQNELWLPVLSFHIYR